MKGNKENGTQEGKDRVDGRRNGIARAKGVERGQRKEEGGEQARKLQIDPSERKLKEGSEKWDRKNGSGKE